MPDEMPNGLPDEMSDNMPLGMRQVECQYLRHIGRHIDF
jgi:hypothetical protein